MNRTGLQKKCLQWTVSSLYSIFFFAILSIFLPPALAYQQIPGVIDLRSDFSDGLYSIDGLAKLARSKGIQVVIVNDHDKMKLSYGLPPFPNILNKSVEQNSILKRGPKAYLQAIQDAARRYPDMVIIPGSLTAPFYFWTGSYLEGDLTAHNHERRLLTIGMEKPEDYRGMPVVHNTGALNRSLLFGSLFFVLSLIGGIVMLIWRGYFRVIGIIVSLMSLLFLLDHHPFRASAFDPFHGDRGIAPYQAVIDYVQARGGMTFWNYPETRSGVRKMGPIHVSTTPHPAVLEESRGYTGFSSLYGDTITLTEPGGIWDVTLHEYCRGYRLWPPWGIATSDFHREGESGEKLGNYQTIFLVREKSKATILKALQTGKTYAAQGKFPQVPRLDDFSVSSPDGTRKAISGEEITLRGDCVVHIAISSPAPPDPMSPGQPVKVRLIRSGGVIAHFEGTLPLEVAYTDTDPRPGEKVFYRMDMKRAGTIVSNPIFVVFEK